MTCPKRIFVQGHRADSVAVPELIERRYGETSTVYCTQYSQKDWHQRLGSGVHADAIIDRSIHNTVWVETGTYNTREHTAMTGALSRMEGTSGSQPHYHWCSLARLVVLNRTIRWCSKHRILTLPSATIAELHYLSGRNIDQARMKRYANHQWRTDPTNLLIISPDRRRENLYRLRDWYRRLPQRALGLLHAYGRLGSGLDVGTR